MKSNYISFIILFSSLLILNQNALAQFNLIQKGQRVMGKTDWAHLGTSVSMPNSNTIAMGAFELVNGGYVRIFSYNGTSWIQKGDSIPGDTAADSHGLSVSMPDSNTVAFVSPRGGYVRIFNWDGSSWIQKGINIVIDTLGPYSVNSICMPNSNTIAIGDPDADPNGLRSGQVRIYSWNGSSWIQKGIEINGDTTLNRLGHSVYMPDINTVAIGAPAGNENNQLIGYARIYNWDGSSWVQKGSDLLGDTLIDGFGYAVSMADSNTIAVGIPRYHWPIVIPIGRVRIFEWNGQSWVQKGSELKGGLYYDAFGTSVSMPHKNIVAVGVPSDQGLLDSSFVQVYKWNGSSWFLKGEVGQINTTFGHSVSMPDTNTLGVGQPHEAPFGPMPSAYPGYVRVYSLINSIGLVENSKIPIKVFPNPVVGICTIEWSDNKINENTKVVLYDMLGNELLARTLGRVGNTYTMDVGHLSAGVYILKVLQDHEVMVTERIVIQK